MFYWIYDVPSWVLAALFSIIFVACSWLGIILTRSRVRRWVSAQPDWNEAMGYVVSGHGVLYGILLGLIAVGTQQNFSAVEKTIDDEAAALAALYQDVSSYPEAPRNALQAMLRTYCRFVIEAEWPAQRRGLINQGGATQVAAFQRQLLSFQPETRGQEILHVETIRQFNTLITVRHNRLRQVTTALPAAMWYVVAVGAVLGIVLTWLFAIDRLSAHLVLAGIVSMLTGLVVYLIVELDHPYRGNVNVTPEAFEIVHKSMTASP